MNVYKNGFLSALITYKNDDSWQKKSRKLKNMFLMIMTWYGVLKHKVALSTQFTEYHEEILHVHGKN